MNFLDIPSIEAPLLPLRESMERKGDKCKGEGM
jgi:hypothetical protein